jgi:glycosyltransferase involved in cell wall biosynthesis
MPLFNKATTVGRALGSVLAQSVRDLEVVVVDDGSTDGGAEVAKGTRDPRVTVVSKPNGGVSTARNLGIELARADLIAFLDADDEWAPDFLETILGLRAAWPHAQVFGTSYEIRVGDDVRRAVLRGVPRGFKRGVLPDYFVVATRSDPPLCASTVAVAREAIALVGGFPLGITAGEDLLTWARLAARYAVAYECAPKAVFWAPPTVRSRTGRTPQTPDRVSAGLAELRSLPGVPERCVGLEAYLGHWHAMRGLILVQLQRRREAVAELSMAVRLDPRPRTALKLILALLPSRAAEGTLRVLRGARRVLARVRGRS